MRWRVKELSTGGGPGGNGGPILISSWKCNFSIYFDIQVYYLDIQAITTLLCLLLALYVLLPSMHSIFYVPAALLKSDMLQHSNAKGYPSFGPTRMGLGSILRGMKWVSRILEKEPIHLAFFYNTWISIFFFKCMRCSKFFFKFTLEGKWSFSIISYTLSHAKSNGTIHFVLSLKLGEPIGFSVAPPKTLYFLCNKFSLHRIENLITDSSIPGKNKSFLFKPFFSRMNNKKIHIYGSTIPLTT